MHGVIYALAEPSGEIRYCGKTVRSLPERLSQHKSDAYRYAKRHLCNWLRLIYERGEHPKDMVCEIINLTGMSRQEQMAKLNAAEQRWIAQLRLLGFDLVNATNGGDGCHGRIVSQETRDKIASSHRGMKRSAQACANIKAGRKLQKSKRGPENPRFGKPQLWRDPQTRIDNILATKASWTPEQRARVINQLLGNKRAAVKLTSKQADEIRSSTRTQSELVAMYGVSQSLISAIKSGKRWPKKEVPQWQE